jgi:hypothetical protein
VDIDGLFATLCISDEESFKVGNLEISDDIFDKDRYIIWYIIWYIMYLFM